MHKRGLRYDHMEGGTLARFLARDIVQDDWVYKMAPGRERAEGRVRSRREYLEPGRGE